MDHNRTPADDRRLCSLYLGKLHLELSKGGRAGYVQKLSKKGWLCKPWESELAMVSMPGTMSEKFSFSVRSDTVAEQHNRAAGKRVVSLYEKHRGIPSSCFGETEYFITNVRIIE